MLFRSFVRLLHRQVGTAEMKVCKGIDWIPGYSVPPQCYRFLETTERLGQNGSGADDIRVTALKSMTGHAIGASGPLETAALALSLQRGQLTPTINYETPDPECDVNVVANRPVEQKVRSALKLSYGFGGHNACLVLSSY